MKEFNYHRAKTLQEALCWLRDFKGDIKVLAGGTDLVVRLKEDMVKEHHILDISGIGELKGIYRDEGYIHVLPLTTHAEIVESPEVASSAPILRQACLSIGSPQIRNRGTLGGNVGNASPAGDSIAALYALEARVKIVSCRGERDIPVEDLFEGPKKTVLSPDEIISDIYMPEMKDDVRGIFKKLGQRDALAISVVNVAVKLKFGSGSKKILKAIIALGAVAPTVVRARKVESALMTVQIGDFLDAPDFTGRLTNICGTVRDEVMPISDVRASMKYRRDISVNLLYEGMLELLTGAGR